MIEILKLGRTRGLIVCEDGVSILETRSGNLLKIARFLIEEKQEYVEEHIFTGNSLYFDLPQDKEEKLKELLHQEFRKENNIFFEGGYD
jgi:hypothetical protein